MAGHTAEEAKAAYRAKYLCSPCPAAVTSFIAHVAFTAYITSNPSPLIPSITATLAAPSLPIIVNSITYLSNPSWSPDASTSTPSAYITEVPDSPDYKYHTFFAIPSYTSSFLALSALPSLPPSPP